MGFIRGQEPHSRHAAHQDNPKAVTGSSRSRSSSWWPFNAADKQRAGGGAGGGGGGLGWGGGGVGGCSVPLWVLLLLLAAHLPLYYHLKQLAAMTPQQSGQQEDRRGLFSVANVDGWERQQDRTQRVPHHGRMPLLQQQEQQQQKQQPQPLDAEQQAADSGSDWTGNSTFIPPPSEFNQERSPLVALMLRLPGVELHATGSKARASYHLQCLQWVEYMWYAGAKLVWWANFGPKPVPLAEEDILRPYMEDTENAHYRQFSFRRLDASSSLRDELAKSIAAIISHSSTPWIVVCFQPDHLPLATAIDISPGWLALALQKREKEDEGEAQVQDQGTWNVKKVAAPYLGLSIPAPKRPGTLLIDSMLDLMKTSAKPALIGPKTTAGRSDRRRSNQQTNVEGNSEAIVQPLSLPCFVRVSLPKHTGQLDEVSTSAMDAMASILMGGDGTSLHATQAKDVDVGRAQGTRRGVTPGESDLLFLILAEEKMEKQQLEDLMLERGKEIFLSTAAVTRAMELKRVADAMRLQVHTMAARAAFEVFEATHKSLKQLRAGQEYLATRTRATAEAEYQRLCSSCDMDHLRTELTDNGGEEASSVEEIDTLHMEKSKSSITVNADNSMKKFPFPTVRKRRKVLTVPTGAQKMLAAVVINRIFLEDKFKMTKYDVLQWVEYYLYAGVDCIYWYDTARTDEESNEYILKPYVDAGRMVYMRFHAKYKDSFDFYYAHDTAVHLFLDYHKNSYTWALFCDGDEYFFSPKDTAKGFLRRYLLQNQKAAKASQIILQNLFFVGPPLPLPPNAFLIERYQYRESDSSGPISRTKPIVRTACVQGLNPGNPHIFPVTCFDRNTYVAPWAELRSNHYWGLRTTDFNPMPKVELDNLVLDNSTLAIVKALKPRLAWAAAATPALQTLPDFRRVDASLEDILPIYRWLT